ncbi:hypothetical protein VW29_19175 [Devosia limi DSM 17137]|uniref:Uncharacterized protein n=1 Tax=Devosia limi DSM 17137 TaxID=1121477 RepID=A0A0F5L4F9_9HYPH|nr:hypothetical protein [Devosia limi]KKB77079.1 hypothetical protein VW29_19175 [Devosia limi DSM 17137]
MKAHLESALVAGPALVLHGRNGHLQHRGHFDLPGGDAPSCRDADAGHCRDDTRAITQLILQIIWRVSRPPDPRQHSLLPH